MRDPMKIPLFAPVVVFGILLAGRSASAWSQTVPSASIPQAPPFPAESSGTGLRHRWTLFGRFRGNSTGAGAARGAGINATGTTGLPRGRRYYNGRYFGSFNNRFYSPQYGYF
jgi:hypothetical protein